ncbi:iron-sulfur cluster assembly scaffold protein [Qipengyuania flava]|uniref:iron-sulfur cluster assembly scaffold protein n=1 Tax=Qipengyuania flava TaxID=192812 RepID=UPI001C631F3C|nr:iron-sulfur cluster assembly scaffold protein [Qipengyuania flava]QYJ06062.1 iron-sulfur cluster assembly scaffold protein [Qipengyuania flava]
MVRSRAPALYSPELLGMAIELADVPFDANAAATGHARSRSCGSVIDVSSKSGERLDGMGLKVAACAVGQASAAIFAHEASGMDEGDVSKVLASLTEWLEGSRDSAFLARLERLEPARAHAGRHEAILLPWRAALDALSKGTRAR